MNRIGGYYKTVGGIQQEQWNLYYGPTGIDKITRTQGGIPNLIIDYSTDPKGRILSMNYSETGGYSGELFAVPNNFGNIAAWSSILGINNYAAIYDPYTAYIDPREIHDPNDLNVLLGWNGKKGDNITIQQVGTGNDLIFNAGFSGGFLITNPWGATDITDSTTTTTTTDTTDKDGGDDAEPCGLTYDPDRFHFKPGDCDKLFNSTETSLRVEFDPSDYNCNLIRYCEHIYFRRYGELESEIKYTIYVLGRFPLDEDEKKDIKRGLEQLIIEQLFVAARWQNLRGWLGRHEKECEKYW